MRSGHYSIRELLAEGDIATLCIPEIQRDYVWGKDNVIPFVRDIVAGMKTMQGQGLDDVVQGIPEQHRADYQLFCKTMLNRQNIGFIYAYFDPEVPSRFYLIDGQQRFTTLFLLLAVLVFIGKTESLRSRFVSRYFSPIPNMSENDFRSYALKVDYKVREMAHDFLQHYVYDLVFPKTATDKLPVNKEIAWWQSRFNGDRTILSLQQNAQVLLEFLKVKAKDGGGLSDFCENLFSYIEEYVEFWYFDTNLSAQGEELYIYMNSRGEQLSYNENRRAACISLCASAEKGQKGTDWDEKLQNQYFIRRGQDGVSADKGFDLYLRTTEMLYWTLQGEGCTKNRGEREEKWFEFFGNRENVGMSDIAQALSDDYFNYQKAVEFLWANASNGLEKIFPEMYKTFRSIQAGRWIGESLLVGIPNENKKIDQGMVLPVLVSLELFKGVDGTTSEGALKKARGALCFLLCLMKHDDVRRNPSAWISRLLELAKELRNYDYDVVELLDSGNELLRPDEKWRLKLLKNFSSNGDPQQDKWARQLKYLELFYELTGNEGHNILFGDVYLLFAVTFDGTGNQTSDEVLRNASDSPFGELKEKLEKARDALIKRFPSYDLNEAACSMLRDYGDYTIGHDGEGLWFMHDLGVDAGRNWDSHWHQIMRYHRGALVAPAANPVVVKYIRSYFDSGVPKVGQLDAVSVPIRLMMKIARSSIGFQLFENLWKHYSYTEGRFRYEKCGDLGDDVYSIQFKTGRTLIDIYLRENITGGKITVGGVDKKFAVFLKECSNSVYALIETDEGRATCELDKLDSVVEYFKKYGKLKNDENSSEVVIGEPI